MTMIRRAALALLATLLLGLAAAPTASAQAFPNRPVRIVVPFAPGGGADILARMVGEKLRESWNQTVIVDNRPGASGVVGTAVVNKAEPDGYMLLMAATGAIRPPQADPAKTFEVTDYFTPITLVAAPPYVIVVHPSVKATSIAELIALAKARPDEISFGSSGVGTASHLSGMLFNQMAGIKLLHVPYKGVGQAVGDLLGGQIAMMFSPPQSVVPHIESGAVRALAVTSPARSPFFPKLPTVNEAGLPGYDSIGWFGLFAPPHTPAPIVTEINQAVRRSLALPDVKEHLAALAAEPAGDTPEEFTRFINEDSAKWDKLLAGSPAP